MNVVALVGRRRAHAILADFQNPASFTFDTGARGRAVEAGFRGEATDPAGAATPMS